METQSISPGLQFIRFSVWLLVAVGTAFLVPQFGFSILLTASGSEIGAALIGVPVLLLVSMFPIAAIVEITIAKRRGFEIRKRTIAAYSVVSILMIVIWGYGEPYLYLGVLHPAGLAALESVILAAAGVLIAVGLYFAWRNENGQVFSEHRFSSLSQT